MSKRTVLIVTKEMIRLGLHATELGADYEVAYAASHATAHLHDAVVYDIPGLEGSVDLRWLTTTELPVVVISPSDFVPVDDGPKVRVLIHPVVPAQISEALAEILESQETK